MLISLISCFNITQIRPKSLPAFKLILINVQMKIWKSQLNWLTITAGGLIATLLLANDVRATASIATATNSQLKG
jgi:hypothetical protein